VLAPVVVAAQVELEELVAALLDLLLLMTLELDMVADAVATQVDQERRAVAVAAAVLL
jgi:hypothetical protein